MEFSELLETRRSIRKYKEKTVDRTMVEKIICAAQQAPSWKNSQTARYYIAITPEKVNKVRDTALPEFNRKNTLKGTSKNCA